MAKRKRLTDEELGSIKGLEYEIACLEREKIKSKSDTRKMILDTDIRFIKEHIEEIKGLK